MSRYSSDNLGKNATVKIEPEKEDGNKEYKLKLIDYQAVDNIASQMRYRIGEGCGEAIYTIGVTDCGGVLGITDEEFKTTEQILDLVAQKNNYTLTMLSKNQVDKDKNTYEYLVRENNNPHYIDIKVACAGNVDTGKCEAKNTKIKLLSGVYKNIQDIKVGDILCGDDGMPRQVLKTTTGYGQMFKIQPRYGDPLIVNKNHILCLKAVNCNYLFFDDKNCRYCVNCFSWQNNLPKIQMFYFPVHDENKCYYHDKIFSSQSEKNAYIFLENFLNNFNTIQRGTIVEITLEQYVNLDRNTLNCLNLYRVPIHYKEQVIPFDPYILGYLTNSKDKIKIKCLNVLSRFKKNLTGHNVSLVQNGEYYELTGESKFLKNYDGESIPTIYKYNSKVVREMVLGGIIDSHSVYKNTKGYKIFIDKNRDKLIQDIVEISLSLGIRVYTKKKNQYVKIYMMGKNIIPIQTESRKNTHVKDIDCSIMPIENIFLHEEQQYYGFELDGNGRYLHDDFIVTHNSSLLGVLLSGENDDGRGKSRLNVFNFQHEVKTGRTSSIAQHILGFDSKGRVQNYFDSLGYRKTWSDIVLSSSKIITFFDLCGHERYLKTTITGLTSQFPDLVFILVGGNMGLTKMTREHIFLAISLSIPFVIIVTKIDICKDRQDILTQTLKDIKQLLSCAGVRRIPYDVKTDEDIILCAKHINSLSTVPIFQVSNVSGYNIDKLLKFLNLFNKRKIMTLGQDNRVEMYIAQIFHVSGVGLVLGGQLVKGQIKIGDKLIVGPNNNYYNTIQVRSIHCKKTPVDVVDAGCYVCIGIKKNENFSIRRGNVILSLSDNPVQVRQFQAEISVVKSQSTTIKVGYEPIIHCLAVRQPVRIVEISDKKCTRGKNDDQNILRTGDRAIIKFKFSKRPEYICSGAQILLAEGRVKIIGKIFATEQETLKII
jgi:GTPase